MRWKSTMRESLKASNMISVSQSLEKKSSSSRSMSSSRNIRMKCKVSLTTTRSRPLSVKQISASSTRSCRNSSLSSLYSKTNPRKRSRRWKKIFLLQRRSVTDWDLRVRSHSRIREKALKRPLNVSTTKSKRKKNCLRRKKEISKMLSMKLTRIPKPNWPSLRNSMIQRNRDLNRGLANSRLRPPKDRLSLNWISRDKSHMNRSRKKNSKRTWRWRSSILMINWWTSATRAIIQSPFSSNS